MLGNLLVWRQEINWSHRILLKLVCLNHLALVRVGWQVNSIGLIGHVRLEALHRWHVLDWLARRKLALSISNHILLTLVLNLGNSRQRMLIHRCHILTIIRRRHLIHTLFILTNYHIFEMSLVGANWLAHIHSHSSTRWIFFSVSDSWSHVLSVWFIVVIAVNVVG